MVTRTSFTRLCVICFFMVNLFSTALVAQTSSLSISGGYGIYCSQSPEISNRGMMGLQFGGFYHMESPAFFPGTLQMVKVTASGLYGLGRNLELDGMVTGFASYSLGDHFRQNRYRTGLGIGKIGLKWRLSFGHTPSRTQALKLSLRLPAGALFVTRPGYLFDGNDYALELDHLTAWELSPTVQSLFNLGYVRNDLQNKWNVEDALVTSFAIRWDYRSDWQFFLDLYSQSFFDSHFDLFQDYLLFSLGTQYWFLPTTAVQFGFLHNLSRTTPAIPFQIRENWQIHIGLTFHFDTHHPDRDRDGIDDRYDLDLATPRGWPVDGFGVPVDSDRDGVPDAIDQEMFTPPGDMVDFFGVSRTFFSEPAQQFAGYFPDDKKLVSSRQKFARDNQSRDTASDSREDFSLLSMAEMPHFGVYFDFGSARLKSCCYKLLNLIGNYLQINKRLYLEIAGFADSIGSKEYNYFLSRKRAEAVQNYLQRRFPSIRERLLVRAYGEATRGESGEVDTPKAFQRVVKFRLLNKEMMASQF